MSTKTPIRTDGTFGKLYTKTQDVRSVVKLHRKRTRSVKKSLNGLISRWFRDRLCDRLGVGDMVLE